MYVCICAAVTEPQVRACIGAGARTVEEIGERTQAGTGCGTCRERLGMLVKDATPGIDPHGAWGRLPRSA
jgi:bacterioferritin-associated ferredoxin